MGKKFVSIRTKLVRSNMLMIFMIFLIVLSVITFLNVQNVNKSIKKSEAQIRSSLIAKGRTLASNNALAMRGMAADWAFTAIQALVSETVKTDPDIEYGIYMDRESVPWVNASEKNPSGSVGSPAPLTDILSQWAAALTALDHNTSIFNNEERIEFASPVMLDNEILGFIRYGFNTRSMHAALKEAYENGIRSRNQTILVLIMIGLLTLIFSFLTVRRMAAAMTRPIGSLVESANAIAEGNYNIQIQSETSDEIGNLAGHFETMRGKVKRYTDHLQELVDEKMQQVNDILNNIDQGLFTINLDGTVNPEYSARANGILKVKDVASYSLKELFRMDKNQEKSFRVWMDLILKKHDRLRWNKLSRLAPVREIELPVRNRDIPDYVAIEYQKIYDNSGRLSKIMVLALDETEKRLKEMQMEEQRLKHESEMNIILGLVNTPPAEVGEFVEDTTERMKRSWQTVSSYLARARKNMTENQKPARVIGEDKINQLYRDIHTIKGNSGSYGFKLLSKHAHEAENGILNLQDPDKTDQTPALEEIIEQIDFMKSDLDEIQQKIQLIFGTEKDAAMRIPRSLVQSIIKSCADIDNASVPPDMADLFENCRRLSWLPVETITRKYQKIVNRMARRNRKNMKFIIIPEHVFFPPDILYDIDDILIHIIRNAADHGIEMPELREELGKGMGRIIFELQWLPDRSRMIRISDNGRGIDVEKLTDICIQKGLVTRDRVEHMTEDEKCSLIFYAGVSTAEEVTDISGRGMGMDIVKNKLEKIGGTAAITSKKDAGTTITLSLPPGSRIGRKYALSEFGTTLTELKEPLSRIAGDCFHILFNRHPQIREPWNLAKGPNTDCCHLIYVQCENREFKGIITAGIRQDRIPGFFGQDEDADPDMVLDALGEFANNYAAMIMDESVFGDAFGILRSLPPVLNQVSNMTLPEFFRELKWINGYLYINEYRISVGFSIGRQNPESGL